MDLNLKNVTVEMAKKIIEEQQKLLDGNVNYIDKMDAVIHNLKEIIDTQTDILSGQELWDECPKCNDHQRFIKNGFCLTCNGVVLDDIKNIAFFCTLNCGVKGSGCVFHDPTLDKIEHIKYSGCKHTGKEIFNSLTQDEKPTEEEASHFKCDKEGCTDERPHEHQNPPIPDNVDDQIEEKRLMEDEENDMSHDNHDNG